MSQIKALYFDLDNTLIDRDKAFWLCMEDFFEKHLSNYNPKLEKEILLQKDNFGYTSRTVFSEWFVAYYQPKEITATDFFNYQIENISKYIPKSSNVLLSMLEQLKKEFRIGIITNGSVKNQMAKIKNAKLDEIFPKESIYISQVYNTEKPKPKLFNIVLKDLKISPKNVLYIGDNPINDIFAPKQLEIKTCWIKNGRKWIENFSADMEIDSIIQFRVLKKI